MITNHGLVSGTPASEGLVSFTAHVEDTIGAYGETLFSFTVNPAVDITTDPTLPTATTGEEYSITLESTGGTGARAWTDLNDDLSGTEFSLTVQGVLSGTPTVEDTIVFTTHAQDQVGAYDELEFTLVVELGYVFGDANFSGEVDIDDVVYLISYLFSSGPEPIPLETGDVNCSGFIDIDDVVFLIDYLFAGGPAPEC